MDSKNLAIDENRASGGFDDLGLLDIPGRGLPGESNCGSAPSCLPEVPAVMSAPEASSTVSFSTDDVPEKDRVAMWREHFGRRALRVEIEPIEIDEAPFEASVTSRILSGLHLLKGSMSAGRLTRTRELIADGNDDLLLVINRAGTMGFSASGREVSLREGDAVLRSNDEVTVFERRCYGESLTLRIPRSILSSLVLDADGAAMRLIPRESEALRLLTGYVKGLIDEHELAAPELQHLVAGHVSDLAALAIGATWDAESTANMRGMPAARLRAAKSYIIENSGRRDLSTGMVAAHLGVTPRYLQRLFETDGKTLSAWLLTQRLGRAYRMLCNSQLAHQPVSAIAYDVGFSDLSYFNRCFRKLHGVTPRDVRKAAAKSNGTGGSTE